jgi:hypothetical protein
MSGLLRSVTKHLLHICSFLAGSYVSAIALAYADSEAKSFITVLNSLGVFFASLGAVTALLTLFHVVYSRIEDKENEEVNYFKYTMFILDRQARFISMYEARISRVLDENEIKRALQQEAIKFDKELTDVISIEKSLCLLSSPNHDLLSELDRCQRDFKALSHTIETRNHLYINDYHRKVQDHLIPKVPFTRRELEKLVGNSLIPSLVEFTNEMYIKLPIVRKHITDVRDQMQEEFSSKYPYRKFEK